MGDAGTDAAVETAHVTLMADDLDKIPWLVKHSRRTLGIIRTNIAFALGVKAILETGHLVAPGERFDTLLTMAATAGYQATIDYFDIRLQRILGRAETRIQTF